MKKDIGDFVEKLISINRDQKPSYLQDLGELRTEVRNMKKSDWLDYNEDLINMVNILVRGMESKGIFKRGFVFNFRMNEENKELISNKIYNELVIEEILFNDFDMIELKDFKFIDFIIDDECNEFKIEYTSKSKDYYWDTKKISFNFESSIYNLIDLKLSLEVEEFMETKKNELKEYHKKIKNNRINLDIDEEIPERLSKEKKEWMIEMGLINELDEDDTI